MLPAAHRFWLCTVITWAPNYILFSLNNLICIYYYLFPVAYLTGNWRTLVRAGSIASVIALGICTFLLPESPKFLVQKKRINRAVKALEYVTNWKKLENRISREEIEGVVVRACELTGKLSEKAQKHSFLDLYSTKTLAIRTVVVSLGMFSLSYVTYGLIFNLHVIKGSIYLNTAFSGTLRWIVGAAVALADHFGRKSVGRRRMHVATMSLIMSCMALTFLIKIAGYDIQFATAIRVFTLLAFGTTGSVFLQILLVTSELFPTGVRNLANAHNNVCGRLGNVFGPMAFSLAVPLNGFPYLLMTLLCLSDVILFQFFIPETKGQPLPSEMPIRNKKETALDSLEMEQLTKA